MLNKNSMKEKIFSKWWKYCQWSRWLCVNCKKWESEASNETRKLQATRMDNGQLIPLENAKFCDLKKCGDKKS